MSGEEEGDRLSGSHGSIDIPGIRIASVDVGHRCGSCSIWIDGEARGIWSCILDLYVRDDSRPIVGDGNSESYRFAEIIGVFI